MTNSFLSLENLNVSLGGQPVLKDINLSIGSDEYWAITGASGSGKTILAQTLAGRHFFRGTIHALFGSPETFQRFIMLVDQQHRFRNITNLNDFYYQQRYNSFDATQTITVGEYLSPYISSDAAGVDRSWTVILKQLKIDHLMQEPLIQLSNGENKRLQLVKALLQKQHLLILDQPYIGLDVEGRKLLDDILTELSTTGTKLLLITSLDHIPEYITHVAVLDNGRLVAASSKKNYISSKPLHSFLPTVDTERLRTLNARGSHDFVLAVKMVNVNIRYGDKDILQHISWEVRRGEKWNLAGANGAGKSTLLSLIAGDNPQAYANEIYLFDRRRGSGESIWDIKQKIGYISPELHLYFDRAATSFHAIASGLFDTMGLFRRLNTEQENLVMEWMQLLGLQDKKNRLLSQLSLGEQKFVLLARAMIKNPALLILDEPCQGLDEAHIRLFKTLIDELCQMRDATLIYVSHYQHEIPDCVDQTFRLELGK